MGIHVTGYSLFGSNGKAMLSLEPVVTLANKYKTTPGKILLRWAVDRGISVVPKSTNAERLATNLEIESFKLTAEEIASINACDKNKSVFDRVEMGWGYNPFA
jgi:diketogulonate reductase-like aldo/keto reductase